MEGPLMRMHVLVVHDDASLLQAMAHALRHAGFTVQAVADPMVATDCLDARPPDALVTRVDFGRGKLNGIALARMARIRRIGMAVVFVPARDWGDLLTGVGEVLPLPFAMNSLVAVLHQQLGMRMAA